jgi:hypothetical protein
LAELERRVEALESAASSQPPVDAAPVPTHAPPAAPEAPVFDGGRLWALDGLKERVGGRGAVLFTGATSAGQGTTYEWQFGVLVDDLLGELADVADIGRFTDALAALAQPARLRVLLAVLEGRHTSAELGAIEGSGTTGQLYHHVRQLTAAGWLRSTERGRYEIPPERVVPLLVILAAARR